MVLPTRVNEIIKKRRVVVNENLVQEFVNDLNVGVAGKDKRFSKLGSLLSATPKSTKSSTATVNQIIQFQSPLLANLSNSNPFCNSGFPVKKI